MRAFKIVFILALFQLALGLSFGAFLGKFHEEVEGWCTREIEDHASVHGIPSMPTEHQMSLLLMDEYPGGTALAHSKEMHVPPPPVPQDAADPHLKKLMLYMAQSAKEKAVAEVRFSAMERLLRFHVHASALALVILVVGAFAAKLAVGIRVKAIAVIALAAGALAYPYGWLLAGWATPIHGVHAAMGKGEIIQAPAGLLVILSVLAITALSLKGWDK